MATKGNKELSRSAKQVTRELSAEEKAAFKEAFAEFDTNGDGKISQKEFAAVLKSIGHNPSKEELKAVMSTFDFDGNGVIDFDEFVIMMVFFLEEAEKEEKKAARTKSKKEMRAAGKDLMKNLTQEEKGRLKKVFTQFDKDGDGKICRREFHAAMKEMEFGDDDEAIDELMNSFDLDGNGILDFEEFVLLIAYCIHLADKEEEEEKKNAPLTTKEVATAAQQASKGLTDEEKKEVKKAFVAFDKDNDGKLSVAEFPAVMKELGRNPTQEELQRAYKAVDLDGNGFVDYNEFLLMMAMLIEEANRIEREEAAKKARAARQKKVFAKKKA